MARSSACTEQYAHKVFDRGDIVRDAIFRQLRPPQRFPSRIFSARCPISTMRNSLLALSIILLMVGATHDARAEAPLVAKVENAIRNTDPGWRCIRAVLNAPWRQVPSERLLVDSVCDNSSQTEKRENVDLRIFQVDSRTDAEQCLGPVREGKVATGWKVEKFKIGDEGYLATFRNSGRFEIHFRKGTTIVTVSSDSFALVERFAQLVAAQITTT